MSETFKDSSEDIPLVTALICNYNYGHFIGDSIRSALNQTWPHIQVIVIDDGSTDNSREVIRSYGDKIQVILKDNGGQSSAFNAGIAASKGEIICFLDSDDMWKPNKVEEVVKKFQSGPWALVSDGLEDIDRHGNSLPIIKRDIREGELLETLKGEGLTWYFSYSSGLSVRSDVVRKLLPLPEWGWRICADNLIAYGAICHGPAGVIPSALTQYRYHGMNAYAAHQSGTGKIKQQLTNLLMMVKGFHFLNDQLATMGGDPALDLKATYRFYRQYSFIVSARPWYNLTRLWCLNPTYFFSDRSKAPVIRILDSLRYMLLDTILCVAVPLRWSRKYVELRKQFRIAMSKLDARDDYDRRTLEYLMSD